MNTDPRDASVRRGARALHLACAAVLASSSPVAAGQEVRSVTQGLAKVELQNMFECPAGSFVRPSGIGTIVDVTGKSWTVPAQVNWLSGRKAADLYNECSGVQPASMREVQLDKVPVVEIDADGEVITGYLLADNYFELYANGKLVAVDPVPFTPFNSAIVRFKAKRPVSYAVKLVDWEEHLGVGTERDRDGKPHAGDGGFVAAFSDGTVTDQSWKAQSFYIAPLKTPDEVVEKGAVHDTSKLGRTYPQAEAVASCGSTCYAVHYPIAADWAAFHFDDRPWPAAFEYTLEQIGAERLKAYTNFPQAFAGARPIWSANLVYDNVVLARRKGR